MARFSFFLAVALLACTGTIGTAGNSEPPPTLDEVIPPPLPSGETLAPTGLTRLSALEYDRSLAILLEDDTRPARALLPEDARTPFDNDYEVQGASQALIEGTELLAQEATSRLLVDTERRDRIVGCTPTGPADAECMESFVRSFGRRAFRRDITDEDVSFFVTGDGGWPGAMGMAGSFNDFYEGVRGVLNVFLQDPEFLYRVEIGSPHESAENVFRLSNYEIATRLSFFLWGRIPDDALLDRAAAGELQDPAIRMEEAMRLLEDERAHERFTLFHAMWLGYEKLYSGSELSVAMRDETRALVDRILFSEEGPWQDLFRSEETYVNAVLAENYGLPVPEGGADWVPYQMDIRRGLFSHGSFLALGLKGNDTSPVMRGIAVQRNAFCQTILPPPPSVVVDDGPVSDAICKPERYSMHSEGDCARCHRSIDPVGFGLENFNARGAYRTHEADNADTDADESQCVIEGQGYLDGVGEFRGPGGLAAQGLASGLLRDCFVNHVHRLLIGRGRVRPVDELVIEELNERLPNDDFTLVDVVRTVVENELFTLRREEN